MNEGISITEWLHIGSVPVQLAVIWAMVRWLQSGFEQLRDEVRKLELEYQGRVTVLETKVGHIERIENIPPTTPPHGSRIKRPSGGWEP